jgi:hypothetical protein
MYIIRLQQYSINIFEKYGLVWCVIIVCVTSCATPSSPTGGPPDREGPEIVRTEPETGTVNFSRRSITLHFSEFIRRSSLNQAIIIEPDIGITYELDWGRKSVEIVFDEAIPDLTTLIVTIGTELQDHNGNNMSEPYKVAVSTGPEIDEGKLFGRVINARTGERDESHRILLYREPVDLSEGANYIASTDTGGVFQFSYLREGKYKAFWVDDRNRNKIWDRKQERAQPFNQEFVELAKAEADTLGNVYVTTIDTTKPVLQGIGLFSSQRLRMRFSENIELTDSTEIAVTDTVGTFYSEVYPLYIQPNDRFVLFAQSQKELLETSSFGIDISGIVDGIGNPLDNITQTFTGSAQADTTKQRIIERNNIAGYYPSTPVEVTYAKPITEPEIRDSLEIVAGTEVVTDSVDVEIQRNILRISPRKTWKDGLQYEFRIWDPIISDFRKFQPNIWHASRIGRINVIAQDSTLKNIRLRVENEESGIIRDTVFTDQIEISNLPPLNYRVTAYYDRIDNGGWDYGQVDPYIQPEPYFIQTQVPVEQGMTGDLTIGFEN